MIELRSRIEPEVEWFGVWVLLDTVCYLEYDRNYKINPLIYKIFYRNFGYIS